MGGGALKLVWGGSVPACLLFVCIVYVFYHVQNVMCNKMVYSIFFIPCGITSNFG